MSPSEPGERLLSRTALTIRWSDLDSFGHVNNTAFLDFAQEARLAWFASIDGPWMDASVMPVVAATQMNYRRQLTWPETLDVQVILRRVGTTSITLAHRLARANDADVLYADGEVVVVWIDPASGKPVGLPPAVRRACGGA